MIRLCAIVDWKLLAKPKYSKYEQGSGFHPRPRIGHSLEWWASIRRERGMHLQISLADVGDNSRE
ncbi:hypothetical protein PHLCEN_2v6869 [Hermanssonia centrifuga]|uniref:Uncharacterized protein n=1 Tax=Hermanssonia centrifuga TaxID=98765 RepID=A0A2R6NYA8_9APHY|nr:hypothetical protein PHLCEN_2v6869 [Hermanssonia centrifuga]